LLQRTFAALDDADVSLVVVQYWFDAQTEGRRSDTQPAIRQRGRTADADTRYTFSNDRTAFIADEHGKFGAADIKFLRISFAACDARLLQQVQGVDGLLKTAGPLMRALRLSMPH